MADAMYDNYKNLMWGSGTHALPNWASDNIKIIGLDEADHTVDTSADVDHADLTAGGIVFTSGNIANGSVTAGVIDHDDITVSAVSGDEFESLVYFFDSGTSATSPLLFNIDSATGLPFTPSGGDIDIVVNPSGLATL